MNINHHIMASTGSPTKKLSMSSFAIYDENGSDQSGHLNRQPSTRPVPLTTSKYANQQKMNTSNFNKDFVTKEFIPSIWAKRQPPQMSQREHEENTENKSSSSSATDPYATTPTTDFGSSEVRPEELEVARLKRQLELTTERMAQMELQLTQSRRVQHTMEEAIGSPFPAAQHLAANINNRGSMLGHSSNDSSRSDTPLERTSFNLSPLCIGSMPNYRRSNVSYGGHLGDSTAPITSGISPTPFMTTASRDALLQPPVGTRLSATATEFGVGRGQWGRQMTTAHADITEPLNYRRLLDRNAACNWKYIVDKIICNNDQQASIFLQQKLKVGTPEQRYAMVEAIIEQAYPLMVNRFGNFLVQRCFEHGTPEQIVLIAEAIRGNTLNLSMDAFGCHVVQKAFDCVPEEYKAIMVHELLRRIPETVIHRYACHVWQKLFELRWSDSPPQIMRYVNEALCGMWHEVALGETGSLVVQNIFENCLEEDKRPCIEEVLSSIDVVAHGQFGNWCIQHLCEHGSVSDRTRAIDHILRFAGEYSTDQYASKVIEKCLRTGGVDFLDRYLDRVTEARPDRPRMPLIDIAGDQFGNYLVQFILTNGDPERREIIAAHIRKHMVSLRGSKYGSRVAMLCCNPAVTTRPGPPTGMPTNRHGPTFGGDRFAIDGRSYSNERTFTPRQSFGGAFR